jgi:chaperonin cofactor prefoldin
MANWKDIMKQVGEALGLLKSKMSRLESQREAAKLSLQKAMAALQAHLLDGDDSDEKTTGNLQAKVDSARSLVASLNTAIETQADRVVQAERELADEETKKQRTAASNAIYADVEHIEKQLAPWLATTRALATDLRKYAGFRTETSAIAEFITNASNEAELALSVSIPDLRGGALAVLDGRERIPVQPGVVVKMVAPAPTTERLFLTQPLAWYDADGTRNRAPSMHDANLPLTLVAKARAIGAAHDLKSDIRSKNHGSKTSAPPAWEHCKMLNDDPKAKTDVEPIMASSPFEVVDRGPAITGTMRQPAQPQAATRSIDGGGKGGRR